jgi:RIO kinase 1
VPRFRISRDASSAFGANDDDEFSDDDDFDDLHDQFDEPPAARRRGRPTRITDAPRLVLEGKSGRRLVDSDAAAQDPDEADDPGSADNSRRADDRADVPAAVPYSSYDVATHGPRPVPDWLVTSLSARDTRLGVIKTGKEADVGLLDRSLPGGPGCLLAVKTFRTADHRMFHRDAGYLEGRRVRRSREGRAMAARSSFGRELLAGQWANAEFVALSAIWKAGARVPYPVQVIGSELMMEFIGGPDGTAAPRLAAFDGTTSVFTDLWHDLVSSLEVLAEAGLTHGDLSPYNVLVDEQGCVVIDLPQVVDLVANPQGDDFLLRDCRNIADFFARRGVLAADAETLALHLGGLARR